MPYCTRRKYIIRIADDLSTPRTSIYYPRHVKNCAAYRTGEPNDAESSGPTSFRILDRNFLMFISIQVDPDNTEVE